MVDIFSASWLFEDGRGGEAERSRRWGSQAAALPATPTANGGSGPPRAGRRKQFFSSLVLMTCQPDLDLPQLSRVLIGFAEELRVAGVVSIFVFPILRRVRPHGVRRETYRQRQEAVNRNWASRFRRPPVDFTTGRWGSR